MLLTVFFFFIAVIITQLFYFIIVFRKFSFSKPIVFNSNNVPVSVIVCAKNESENVKKLIPILIQQEYKKFEIVLIDDASSDDTIDVFETFEKDNKIIKIVRVENNEAFWGNKKFALTMGIKAASYNHLLFIDADCYPNSINWISQMTAQFSNKKEIVLGYGAYEKVKGSFLNKVIRFETLLTAIQYFSWANFGKPYMGVGRNLAYKRESFFAVNGFINHMKIPSGDDDLFVNEASNDKNVAICFCPESFTFSKPEKSYKDWFCQKRRHITTAKHYKFFDKMQLTIFYMSQLLFIILPIILFLFQYQWIAVIGLISFRYISNWIIISNSAKRLKENDLIIWYPILEIMLVYIQLRLFITNIFSKPTHWK